MFSTLFVWYTQLLLVSTRLVIFSDFKELQIFQVFFPHFLFDIPCYIRKIFLEYWFPQGLSFFHISRKCNYFKLCFPHFLFDIPSSVIRNISKYWFPPDLSFFLDFMELQIVQVFFHSFCLIYPAM